MVLSEAKIKHQQRVEAAHKSQVNYYEMVQITLKEFIDHFQPDFNDIASIIIAIEETMRITGKEHKTEINISIGMT